MRDLDDNSIPILYELYLNIDINKYIYTGSNNIKLQIINPTNKIQFHGKDLIIDKILFETNEIQEIKYDNLSDIYTIQFENILNPDYYNILIKFSGKISDDDGIIKYYHKQSNRKYIYTRFEPISARKCYPCWDEPKYRVKYRTSIEINDNSYLVLFNTDPELINNISPNKIIYVFKETIQMSSYVNSFIIAKYTYIEAVSKHNIRMRVYIPSDIRDISCGDFALECGIKMLDFIIEYYGISFPYNKIDFIPINNTSAMGMENYGLIFYDIDYLLFDVKTSTINQRIQIAHVIAHELVHQWFGNLFSIDKWNSLWLKESFANFFEYFIIEKIFPSWDTKLYNITNILQTLDYDSLCFKPIQIEHIQNKNIDIIYSKLTYKKGGVLLNIIFKYIGEEQFKNNIRKYLNDNKHKTVNTEIFIKSICYNLDEKKQKKIKQLILQHTLIKSYPIIKIIDNKINTMSFNCLDIINNNIKNTISDKLDCIDWQIPINLKNNKLNNKQINYETECCYCRSHNKDKEQFEYIIFESDNILDYTQIINNKEYCYYRFHYDKEQFKYILNNIQNETLSQYLSIINDLYILGIYSICPIEYWVIYTNKLINLLLNNDDKCMYNYYLISTIYNNIQYVNRLVKNNKIEKLLVKPMDNLINKLSKLFDVFNINIYLTQNLISDNISNNQLIFFLLNIDSKDSTILINELFDKNLFNLYGNLNRIIINRIINNNDTKRLSKFNYILLNYPHMYDIILNSLPFIKNKHVMDYIFNNIIYNITQIDYQFVINLFSNNKYFLLKFTEYFLDKSKLNLSLSTDKFIDKLIVSQTNNDLILKIFDKVRKNNKIIESKYILINKLYRKSNIIKLINSIRL